MGWHDTKNNHVVFVLDHLNTITCLWHEYQLIYGNIIVKIN